MKRLVVAIDGPAGAGKSTVAQLAAKKLGYTYIDTGAMYRAVAWKVLQQQEVTDERILEVIRDIDVDLHYAKGKTTVTVDGEDVSAAIRTPEVSAVVSRVAALGPVRTKMVDLQRKMAKRGAVLMDGRDIATNVLPHADVKIFLTASIEERARRRWKEMKEKGYDKFSINKHTEIWKSRNAKDPKHGYGVQISKTWYWYETWLKEVEKYCEEHSDELKS